MEIAMHFYPFHIGDYAKHTKGLSIIEDIAYRRILDEYYLSERPPKGSSTDVARMIGMREYIDDVSYVLERFFDKCDEGWFSSRANAEINKYHGIVEQKSKAGKASAEARRNKRLTDVEQVLDNSCTDGVQTKNQEPRTNNHIKETTTGRSAPKGTRLPSDWELPDEYAKFCREQRPDLNPHHVADQFKDYWHSVAGQKGVKADWFATWRNWVRNQKTENKKTNWADKQKAWLDEATGKTQRSDMKTIDADWDIFTTRGDQNVITDNRN
jgi:uncharacterized protein YdaU (DUF1376 family)